MSETSDIDDLMIAVTEVPIAAWEAQRLVGIVASVRSGSAPRAALWGVVVHLLLTLSARGDVGVVAVAAARLSPHLKSVSV